ncbi:MAG TPA: ROK family transcriptional regulator [Aggregatilineales bacterium]|nr:ROK family transcriptional regulator [Aggregatilineales bacterium]
MKRPYMVTATDMRRINRSAILELIRREGPISRTLIGETLDVSLPTVMRVIDELFEEGLVREQGAKEWSGGRRRALLEFNAEGHVVVGIDMGGTRMFGAIADLGGSILHEAEFDRRGSTSEENYGRLVQLIETLMADPRLEGRDILGIGVGAPGVTIHQEGIVAWAPSLGWRDYPLREKLAERFGLPIMVDNDVNLGALGELWFGAGQDVQNMILVTIGSGIGAGIIIDGALYRGAHEAAGEVGYLMPGREFLGKPYTEFGATEYLAAGTGIAERARQVLKHERSEAELAALSFDDVFAAVRQGAPWARKVLDEALDYMAIMISSIGAYFDPELIVLGGSIARFADLLIEPLLQRMGGTTPVALKLVASTLGHRATVLGAVTNVLHNTGDFYVVHKLS